jgi:hypothetical protein
VNYILTGEKKQLSIAEKSRKKGQAKNVGISQSLKSDTLAFGTVKKSLFRHTSALEAHKAAPGSGLAALENVSAVSKNFYAAQKNVSAVQKNFCAAQKNLYAVQKNFCAISKNVYATPENICAILGNVCAAAANHCAVPGKRFPDLKKCLPVQAKPISIPAGGIPVLEKHMSALTNRVSTSMDVK